MDPPKIFYVERIRSPNYILYTQILLTACTSNRWVLPFHTKQYDTAKVEESQAIDPLIRDTVYSTRITRSPLEDLYSS